MTHWNTLEDGSALLDQTVDLTNNQYVSDLFVSDTTMILQNIRGSVRGNTSSTNELQVVTVSIDHVEDHVEEGAHVIRAAADLHVHVLVAVLLRLFPGSVGGFIQEAAASWSL